ncbi:3-hydroxybutyrate dehydrogenase [Diaphorobacter ruginosibacter]|uniref:3-hydroxybutyrate dehydrogenase n=1 Tax=Diaphorobacter ruginosibacter TaxID=1715720 RepID=A0A7G9RNX7_9BURK|nr:3-hydroxybutyrate dehydrogenase [Diaphorobacter ruginosibacter]QNN57302.1 3-hydroxybutyrate dehydrogenase [Diaphorobacter ruginosibacter]
MWSSKVADLNNRVALVTGGNSGIGLAIARRLARDGADVVINGIVTNEEGGAVALEIASAHGVSARYIRADLRNPAEIESMIRDVEREYGAIDILVNNAGMQHVSSIEAFPVDKWNDMLAVNLSASFHTIRLSLPAMRAKGWGRIVNMASISGLRGRAGKVAYNATKHGLIGLTKAVALETATTDITCNAICPGWALTALVQKQVDALAERESLDNEAATRQLLGARQPSGRFVTVDQLASLASYLCSDDAQEVRGAAWTMDGATTAA